MNQAEYELVQTVRRKLVGMKKRGEIYDFKIGPLGVHIHFYSDRGTVFYGFKSLLKAIKNGLFFVHKEVYRKR